MVRMVEGSLDARGLRFGVVLARFNEAFGRRLLEGALDGLRRHGADEEAITVVRVPGAFELPAGARALAPSVDAVIALGVVIRGATSHYEQVLAEAARGLGEAARHAGVPVIYGVVAADSQEQALERCGGKAGNRGWDAAIAAIEMARLIPQLRPASGDANRKP